ncbi:histidine phosphotransferase family protein [Candidatus Liberibacter americanus]|uniref:Histidine phosphotransferase ChpT C-terminal domain-containing protein n=1 Tax=Candidatus Liberibacter americanus str. Sao Paulo TaxID=1261131 RepID=U6B825_9HYPH|nr:histidine phosphotransferase family protein [Candidatus Liberibacter americanus]AHA27882.1 hypothetical protein lam_529 [Candidatus Liberibacter americanus str. Sao Paulo]EMS36121.1 hypothetical protein G653_03376 [Candidatus Liberibacter americanus PW_SP]
MIKNICFNHSAADLSALLCSRICHDLISPIGAISNGLELLDDAGIEEEAMQLIRMSSKHAISRLKFARLAFGHPGYTSSNFNLTEIKDIIKDFVSIDNKVDISWISSQVSISKQNAKLLLNLFMIAYVSLPKTGNIRIYIEHSAKEDVFSLEISGVLVQFPEKFIKIISGNMDYEIDSYDVQFYYTALLAYESNVELFHHIIDDKKNRFSAVIKKQV